MIIYGLRKLATELFWATLLLLGSVGCGGVGGVPVTATPSKPAFIPLPMPKSPITASGFERLTRWYQLDLLSEIQPYITIDPLKRWLVLKNSTQLLFYDLNTLQDTALRINCPQPCAIAFHPTTNHLLVNNGVYDLDNFGNRVWVYEAPAGYTPSAVTYSPDGSQLAIAYSNSLDTIIQVYNPHSHKLEVLFPPIPNKVEALAFNRDGKLIAAGTNNSLEVKTVATACIADCINLSQVTNGPVHSLAFAKLSETSNQLLMTDQGLIWEITPAGWQLFKSIEPGAITLSPITNLLVVSNRQGIWSYDLTNSSLQRQQIFNPPLFSSNPVVQFSLDGTLLVVGGLVNGSESLAFQIFGDPSLLPYATIPANVACRQGNSDSVLVAFSADGQRLARSTSHCLEIWDFADQLVPKANLSLNDGFIKQLLFWPNGQELAVVVDKGDRDEVIFPLSNTNRQTPLSHTGSIVDMAFMSILPDELEILVTLEAGPAGQQLLFWDWQNRTLTAQNPLTDVEGIALFMKSDNSQLVMATTTGQITSWLNSSHIKNPDLLGIPSTAHFHDAIYLPHQGPVLLSPNELSLFRLNANSKMQISPNPIRAPQESASCSMDSQYIAVISNCQLWLWHVADGQDEVITLLQAAGDCLRNVAFHPLNSHILAATGQSGRLYLWELPQEN